MDAVVRYPLKFQVGARTLFAIDRPLIRIAYTLDMLAGPILAPIRAVVPSLGGLDISPIIAWLIITGMQRYLLPAGCAALYDLLGGGAF